MVHVRALFTQLRAICTISVNEHMTLLGGPGKSIEVGFISMGGKCQNGEQKIFHLFGVLDLALGIVRLRIVEPADASNNAERFANVFHLLPLWVIKTSELVIDETFDKDAYLSIGYQSINQTKASNGEYANSNIKTYLKTVVVPMFNHILLLLPPHTIQQFLDELSWREWYATAPDKTFDHIVSHIAAQTTTKFPDSLVNRLSKVMLTGFFY